MDINKLCSQEENRLEIIQKHKENGVVFKSTEGVFISEIGRASCRERV